MIAGSDSFDIERERDRLKRLRFSFRHFVEHAAFEPAFARERPDGSLVVVDEFVRFLDEFAHLVVELSGELGFEDELVVEVAVLRGVVLDGTAALLPFVGVEGIVRFGEEVRDGREVFGFVAKRGEVILHRLDEFLPDACGVSKRVRGCGAEGRLSR